MCFSQRKDDLKDNKRENFQGTVISRFHFYELRDPPRKPHKVILVAIVTEEWMLGSVPLTHKSIKNDSYTPAYLCYLFHLSLFQKQPFTCVL